MSISMNIIMIIIIVNNNNNNNDNPQVEPRRRVRGNLRKVHEDLRCRGSEDVGATSRSGAVQRKLRELRNLQRALCDALGRLHGVSFVNNTY